MALDPKQASTIATIGTGICVGLIGYLAYVLHSGDSMKAGAASGTAETHGIVQSVPAICWSSLHTA